MDGVHELLSPTSQKHLHIFDKNWQLCNYVLQTRSMAESHTGFELNLE